MNAAEAEMAFPVLGFTPDLANWGFPDLDRLTRCGPFTLKENLQDGMELIDCQYRCWRVVSIRRTGGIRRSWIKILGFAARQSRIEHVLEPLPPSSLEDLRARTIQSMVTHQLDYMGFDGDEAAFAERLDQLRAARSLPEIAAVLGADTFEAY